MNMKYARGHIIGSKHTYLRHTTHIAAVLRLWKLSKTHIHTKPDSGEHNINTGTTDSSTNTYTMNGSNVIV